MTDDDALSAAEAATALDPAIGDGTPDTAPFVVPFSDDDSFDADDAAGMADDDDDVEDGEDDNLIEDDI